MNKDASYYKKMFAISEKDLQLYRSTMEKVRDLKTLFYERFYDWMTTHPIFSNIYLDGVIDGVKETEDAMWNDIIDFPLDDKYVLQQQEFGREFAELGMPYDAYYGAIVGYQQTLYNLLQERELLDLTTAGVFRKTLNVESAIVADTYQAATQKMLAEQNQALKEMSTPVTQLWDDILLLPLVGYIDSKRAQDTMSTMLNMIAKTQSKVFILDISGVAVVDTAVANYLIKITKATRLMGCTCLISGISASVAQTIVELGIHIDEVTTTGSMKEALNQALEMTTGRSGEDRMR